MNIKSAHFEPGRSQSDCTPLVLDVDDVLLHTDLLHETAAAYIRGNPLWVTSLLFWLLQGKAVLKRRLSERWRSWSTAKRSMTLSRILPAMRKGRDAWSVLPRLPRARTV